MKFAPACALLLLASCQGIGGRDAFVDPGGTAPTPAALARAEPRFHAGLESLQQALRSNEDEEARRILGRLWALGPDESTASLLRIFERILGGREAVNAVHLTLKAQPRELPGEFLERMPGARGYALELEILNTLDSSLELRPGPATLVSVREELSNSGAIVRSQDLRPFQLPASIQLAPQGSQRIQLAEFFLAPREQERAVRLGFQLELRSGSMLRDGAQLPAMRWRIVPAAVSERSPRLKATGGIEELLSGLRGISRDSELLDAAVRIPDSGREAALERLCEALDPATRIDLSRCHKALSWLSGESLPEDPAQLQSWVRSRRPQVSKPALVLPGGTVR